MHETFCFQTRKEEQFIKIVEELGFRYKIQNLERGKIKIRISGKRELQKWFDIVGSNNHHYIKRAKIFLDGNLYKQD
jgi:hypothetical protein